MPVSGVKLRPYQEEAHELMTGRGRALLSLCMGAGKTVTSIAAIEDLIDNGAVTTGLVIVPSALKYQWQDEIKRFTGKLSLVIDGPLETRKRLYKYVHKYAYTIINYEAVVNDWTTPSGGKKSVPLVRNLPFDFIIADEVTKLKSMTALRSRRCKFLARRADVVFGLTGQPVENRPEELFSIMEFVDSTVFGDFRVFDPTFLARDEGSGKVLHATNLALLRKTLKPVMYRKKREDIADQFPAVIHSTITVDMSRREAGLYQQAASYTLVKLREAAAMFGSSFSLDAHYGAAEGREQQMKGDIMSGILAMRLICDDPQLLRESGQKWHATQRSKKPSGGGSKLAAKWLDSGMLDDLPDRSSKRTTFLETITEILEEDPANKVVVFSTFKGLLNSVQADTAKLTPSVQFTGDMDAWAKREAQQTFKQDPRTRLFLSSDAGGYGVDLPEANYLISLDLPWSTGAMEQRDARIIRISSEWEHVNIISILMSGSIEMRMAQMIADKRGMAGALIDGTHDIVGVYTPVVGTLTEFLENN